MKNIQGQRFGRLTVLRDSGKRNRNGSAIWMCLCICGQFKEVGSNCLISGHTKSCGCLYGGNNTKHRGTDTRLFRIHRNMKQRCYNPKAHNFERYGGRGITICPKWKNDFIAFREFARRNGYTDSLTVDRIDNDKSYSPDNCQFITLSENIKKGNKNEILQ